MMLCEKCYKDQVSFVISISEDSSKNTIRMCEECATRGKEQIGLGTQGGPKMTDRKCHQCHSRYSPTSLLKCPACYSEFHDELVPLLRRVHGNTVHCGRTPDSRAVSGKKGTKKKSPVHGRAGGSVRRSEGHFDLRPELPAEAEWMQGDGPDSDVVISTRVRLARNVSGHVFCSMAEEPEFQHIAEIVESATADAVARGNLKQLSNASVVKLNHLSDIDREFLIERNLISRDLVERNGAGETIVGEKEIASIMVNEEDHIRLQVINAGLQLRKSWEMISDIDDALEQEIDYAFSPNWGYLTACPTNVGTGLRVSVMLHVPALAATKDGNDLLSSVSNMGYAVRGIYGEGSPTAGAFYQISNEATLGQSEEEIMDRIRSVARQTIEHEREERRLLMERDGVNVEDRVFRAYGTLTNARLISFKEALALLSWVSLGGSIGILSESSRTEIARLLVLIRPAHLQKHEGRRLDARARDIGRATVIRAVLTGICPK